MRLEWVQRSLLLLLALWASLGESLKHSYHIQNDPRTIIGPLGFPFGFSAGGVYNLTVYDFSIEYSDPAEHEHSRQLDDVMAEMDLVGFLLRRFKDESEFNQFMNTLDDDPNICIFQSYVQDHDMYDDEFQIDDTVVEDGAGEILDVLEDGIFLSMTDSDATWGKHKPMVSYTFQPGEEGLYFLVFQMCPPPKSHVHTKFELDFHFSNIDMFGNTSYLSVGEMALPHMFFYFSLWYAICLYLWVSNIRMIGDGGHGHWADPDQGPPVVYPIHHLMTILLVLKMLTLFFESIRYHYLRVAGHAVFWSGVYYTFAFMKGTFLFTVILLIGSGWSFVKPFLSDREKTMVCAILVLQVVNNLAIVVLTQLTEGERSFDRWTVVLHMVDILCCCAVLLPIVWQVNTLEKNLEQSGNHDDAEMVDLQEETEFPPDEWENESSADVRLVAKLKHFRSFYLLVVGYIYATRIVIYLFATLLDYRHTWLRYLVVEGVTLAFYAKVGSLFRPMCDNPYLSLKRNDETEQNGVEMPIRPKENQD